jgi:hypothetical protein
MHNEENTQHLYDYPFCEEKRKLQRIFLDNHNWDFLKKLHPELLHKDVIDIVDNALSCGSNGGITYYCPSCGHMESIGFGCNSKFCTRCGKRLIDIWSEKVAKSVLKTEHRHWVLTLDSRLWPIIDEHRDLLDVLFQSASEFMQAMMTDVARKKLRIPNKIVIPGMVSALHTSGKSIDFKPHLHNIVTEGGLLTTHKNPKQNKNNARWLKLNYFHFDTYRILWRDIVLDNLLYAIPADYYPLIEQIRREQVNGFDIRAPRENIVKDTKHIGKYIARYVRHPPIAESRIDDYDGDFVFFHYTDTETKERVDQQLVVYDFMIKLLKHVQKKNFRMVRYYGLYGNKYKSAYRLIFLTLKFIVPYSESLLAFIQIKTVVLCSKCKTPMIIEFFHPPDPPKTFFGERLNHYYITPHVV